MMLFVVMLAVGLLPRPSVQISCCDLYRDPQFYPPGSYFCFDDSTTSNDAEIQASCANIPRAAQGLSSQYKAGYTCDYAAAAFGPSSPTCRAPSAGLTGDPVLTGFNTETFEFFGLSGHNYSVLVYPSLVLNMMLVAAGPDHLRHQGGKGTFAAGLAVILPSTELIAFVDQAGNMTFSINSAMPDIEQPLNMNDGQIVYEPYKPELGQTVTISSPPFNIMLIAVKQFTDETSGYNRGHFNLVVELSEQPDHSISGVLGETLGKPGKDSLSEESAFEVPFLVYAGAKQPHLVISRRLLEHQPYMDEDFPIFASFGTFS